MKKPSRGILLLWMLIAATAAGGTFLIVQHWTVIAPGSAGGDMTAGTAPDADTATDDAATTSASSPSVSSSVPMKTFSDDGYTIAIPTAWSVERTSDDTVAVHADGTSPDGACKIEISSLPFSLNDDMADWIAHRLGADPSLTVIEQSSGDVPITGGNGVKWTGTIDGVPTTLVYAFGDEHAYELAPSLIGAVAGEEKTDGSAQCDDALQTILASFTI